MPAPGTKLKVRGRPGCITMKVYIAGFDVFAPDAARRKELAVQACRARNLVPLHPLDNEAPNSRGIYEGNLELIREADVVVANLNEFRGPCEPDAGTAFEVGYARALEKRVWAYVQDTSPMQERMGREDERGYAVEDFGLPMNLMLAHSVRLVKGSLEDCLDDLVRETTTKRVIRF